MNLLQLMLWIHLLRLKRRWNKKQCQQSKTLLALCIPYWRGNACWGLQGDLDFGDSGAVDEHREFVTGAVKVIFVEVHADALAYGYGTVLDADDLSGQQTLPKESMTVLVSELIHRATRSFYCKIQIVPPQNGIIFIIPWFT